MAKYVKLWVAVGLSFLFAYGTPLVAAFFLFSEGSDSKEFGGILFYGLVSLILAFLFARLNLILKKMKMSLTKIVVKTTMALFILYFIYQILGYVDANTELLGRQLLAVVGGLALAFPFKAWALYIDRDYIDRIGVFG